MEVAWSDIVAARGRRSFLDGRSSTNSLSAHNAEDLNAETYHTASSPDQPRNENLITKNQLNMALEVNPYVSTDIEEKLFAFIDQCKKGRASEYEVLAFLQTAGVELGEQTRLQELMLDARSA